MKKTLAIFIVISVIVIAGIGVAWTLTKKETPPPGVGTGLPKACTMEAKICPDGSAVGRTGPNCEFAPCPAIKP